MWQYIIGVNVYLTEKQQEENATAFYYYFRARGATVQAICGMLGNINWESGLNPGRKQTTSTTSGWGLIQWTPSTVITNWCSQMGYNWWDGYAQCERIWSEGTETNNAGGTWLPTKEYPYSWDEFLKLTDGHEAVYAYLKERERAGDERVQNRLDYCDKWLVYFNTNPPPPTPTPGRKRKKLPVYMMISRRF